MKETQVQEHEQETQQVEEETVTYQESYKALETAQQI
jgi:hypothetical protein